MESLYSKYISERTTDCVYETPVGYVLYRYINDNQVYIVDIFVEKNSRKNGEAARMADEIVKFAKVRGCKQLIGSVAPSSKNSNDSLKVLLGYGMTLASCSNDFIVFSKEI